MAKYIEREAAIAKLDELCRKWHYTALMPLFIDAIDSLQCYIIDNEQTGIIKERFEKEAITLLQEAMHDITYSQSCDICENHNDYDCRKQKGAECQCRWRFADKATKLIEKLEQEG